MRGPEALGAGPEGRATSPSRSTRTSPSPASKTA